MTPHPTWPRHCLPAGTFLAGGPLLLGLLGGHSERGGGDKSGSWDRGRCRYEARCRDDGSDITWAWRFHAQLSLQVVGEASETRRRLLLVTLALALVAEQLARPHAKEALGAGVGAHGERGVGGGLGCERVDVGTGQRGLHQQGWGQVLAAVDGVGCCFGRVARLWLPWR